MEKIQSQCVFFFKYSFGGPYEEFILAIKSIFGETNNITQLPLDNTVPGNIPRIILNFNNFQINISLNRMDIIIHDTNGTDTLIAKFNSIQYQRYNLEIIRIGYIITFFDREKGILDIKQMLSNRFIENNFDELSIRMNSTFEFCHMKCNNIENYDIGQIAKQQNNDTSEFEKGLVIQRDINTDAASIEPLQKDRRDNFLDEFKKRSNVFCITKGV